MTRLVGRHSERKQLDSALKSVEAELLVVYGRRRVGKTFLLREHLAKEICFELTGAHGASLREQLENFSEALAASIQAPFAPAPPKSWSEAFAHLRRFLEALPQRQPKRVVFLDELPWLAAPRSRFMSAFEHFWNAWAVKQPWLVVVVCGSAAGWMIKNLLAARGGLHNRATRQLRLEPFDLFEARDLLISRGIDPSAYQLLELYLCLGGVPYYLKQMERGETTAQCVDRLCFARNGVLRPEFSRVYSSLFRDSQPHESIVRALATRRKGLLRRELLEALGTRSGGTLTQALVELEESGFIGRTPQWQRAIKDATYRVIDEFSFFHLRWVEGQRSRGKNLWQQKRSTPAWRAWSGYAFEALCEKHIDAIKGALGIEAVETEESAWHHRPKEGMGEGGQIDLVIERRDQAINLCEMKFAEGPYVVDKRLADELRRKRQLFAQVTGTRKSLITTLVTPFGLSEGKHARDAVDVSVTMESLLGQHRS